jgi:hypothetical protein
MFILRNEARCWWLKPVIPEEAGIRRLKVRGQQTLSQKYWWSDSSGRETALLAWDPEFKPQYWQKKHKLKQNKKQCVSIAVGDTQKFLLLVCFFICFVLFYYGKSQPYTTGKGTIKWTKIFAILVSHQHI